MLNETLLITGLTGFVGSHVTEIVDAQGARIRALVRQSSRHEFLEKHGIEPVIGSLEDAESVRRAVEGADVVVHMAAATRAANERQFELANASGTRAVVDAIRTARKRPRRLVYLSSLAAVGPSRNGRPVTASDAPAPLTAYGRTKLQGEVISREAPEGVEVAILRAPAVYGPRERDMYEFFKLARLGVLPLPTGPERHLQLIHVADLARAVVMAATRDGVNGVYHVAEPRAYSWVQVARLVAKAVGKNARLVPIPGFLLTAAGAVSEVVGNVAGKPSIFSRDKARELLAPGWLCETEAARRDFGFEAKIPLEAGFAQTAQWYRENGWL